MIKVFEVLGDLETVLYSLMEAGFPEEAASLKTLQDALIDDALERGDDELMMKIISSTQNEVLAKKVLDISSVTVPKKRVTASGNFMWFGIARYAEDRGRLFMVIGKDPHKRPRNVIAGGRKIRFEKG